MNAQAFTVVADSEDAALPPVTEDGVVGRWEEVVEVARVPVYWENGLMVFPPSSTPSLEGPRPSVLPPDIDLFLWGGLVATVQEAIMLPFLRHRRRVLLCLACGNALSLAPLVLPPPSSDLCAILYALGVVLCVAGSFKAVQFFARGDVPAVRKELAIAVREASPSFRSAGYGLQYGTQKCGFFSVEAFVRIVRGVPPSEVRMDDDTETNPHETADSLLLESNRQRRGISSAAGPLHPSSAHGAGSTPPRVQFNASKRDFRVAVIGLRSTPHILFGRPKKEYDFASGRSPGLRASIDASTWGAIATEMRPYTARYITARAPATLAAAATVVLMVVLSPLLINSSDAWVHWGHYFAIAAYAALVALTGPFFERVVPERLLGQQTFQDLHDEARNKVRELSPLVAERSGYELRYEIESDGCGCRSGYVNFRDVSRWGGVGSAATSDGTGSLALPTK